MPLDPDKMRLVTEKSETLSKRFDALTERRNISDAADDEDEDEDVDLDPTEEVLVEPARAAMEATPGSDLGNLENEEPWFS
jgi:hypothetical protein